MERLTDIKGIIFDYEVRLIQTPVIGRKSCGANMKNIMFLLARLISVKRMCMENVRWRVYHW